MSKNTKQTMSNTLTQSERLRAAADLADQIGDMQARLNELIAGTGTLDATPVHTNVLTTKTGRHFTPESRERIAAAQRRRWRAINKLRKATATPPSIVESSVAAGSQVPQPAAAPAVAQAEPQPQQTPPVSNPRKKAA